MTNAGRKYYYICNYRIKKGYFRCPAVLYALFPNTNTDNPSEGATIDENNIVMVYSCGHHEHKRLNGISTSANNSLLSSPPSSDLLRLNTSLANSMNNPKSILVSPQSKMTKTNNNQIVSKPKLLLNNNNNINSNNTILNKQINRANSHSLSTASSSSSSSSPTLSNINITNNNSNINNNSCNQIFLTFIPMFRELN
jgi:hypothetical protein